MFMFAYEYIFYFPTTRQYLYVWYSFIKIHKHKIVLKKYNNINVIACKNLGESTYFA